MPLLAGNTVNYGDSDYITAYEEYKQIQLLQQTAIQVPIIKQAGEVGPQSALQQPVIQIPVMKQTAQTATQAVLQQEVNYAQDTGTESGIKIDYDTGKLVIDKDLTNESLSAQKDPIIQQNNMSYLPDKKYILIGLGVFIIGFLISRE